MPAQNVPSDPAATGGQTNAARTKRTLACAIREELARIRPQDARAYFTHGG